MVQGLVSTTVCSRQLLKQPLFICTSIGILMPFLYHILNVSFSDVALIVLSLLLPLSLSRTPSPSLLEYLFLLRLCSHLLALPAFPCFHSARLNFFCFLCVSLSHSSISLFFPLSLLPSFFPLPSLSTLFWLSLFSTMSLLFSFSSLIPTYQFRAPATLLFRLFL